MKPAVFLDRDGVIVPDTGLLADPEKVRLLPNAGAAVKSLQEGGYMIVVVTNQPVVARGMASEDDVRATNDRVGQLLADMGARVDRFYYCPHHPNGTLKEFRVVCECRKPAPGMLLQAAREMGIDTARSYMVGDRISDIVAGHLAGCSTVLLETGEHSAAPIESTFMDTSIRPDAVFSGIGAAASWIRSRPVR